MNQYDSLLLPIEIAVHNLLRKNPYIKLQTIILSFALPLIYSLSIVNELCHPLRWMGPYTYCENLSTVTIGSSVKTIGIGAFALCTSLSSINIPQSVTEIKDWAFDSCDGLTSLVIPSSVSSIGYQAFQGCTRLNEVTIGSGVTAIGSKAFDKCNALQSITCADVVKPSGFTNIFHITS